MWLYLRKNLPRKRPQKLTIIDKFLIHFPILVVLVFIAHSLYLILIEEDDPFFKKFICIINFNKYINKLPTPLLELIYNNKYLKPNLDPDSLFPIYFMLSCTNAIKNLLITWYQEGNAKAANFEVFF